MMCHTDKSGADPSSVEALALYIRDKCPQLRLAGLMTIGAVESSTSGGENPDFQVGTKRRGSNDVTNENFPFNATLNVKQLGWDKQKSEENCMSGKVTKVCPAGGVWGIPCFLLVCTHMHVQQYKKS